MHDIFHIPLGGYSFRFLQLRLAHVSQCRTLVANKGYDVITADVYVKGKAR